MHIGIKKLSAEKTENPFPQSKRIRGFSFCRRKSRSQKKIRQIPEIVLDISERLGIIGAFPKGI